MRAYCVLQYALKFMRKVMLKTRKCDRMTEINKLEVVILKNIKLEEQKHGFIRTVWKKKRS